jgi:pimeloyl-ACP methyl ester carboxylesterase
MTSELLGAARQVELTQGILHYREAGAGDPLLFVHGALANGDLWRGVAPELSGDYRCLTPDWPKGSHRTAMHPDADLSPPGMARLVIDFLDAVGIDRVTLIANDSGGAISQMVAAAHPDRIERLVLTSCDTFGQFPPRYLKPLHPLTFVPGLGEWVARSWRLKPVHRLFYWSIVKHGLPPEILDSYVAHLADPGIRRDMIKFFRGTGPRHTIRAARRLRGYPRPTLIVWAGDDLWFRRKNGMKLAALIPGSEFVVLADARTFVPEDQPMELAGLIREFLATHPPRSGLGLTAD